MTVALPDRPPSGRMKLKWTTVAADADVVTLVTEADMASEAHPIYRRVHMALLSVRMVWLGEACLTRVGAAYLGVHYQPLHHEEVPH